MSKAWLAALAVFSLAIPAKAAQNGMYLCETPVVAASFWADYQATQKPKVRMSDETLKGLADKNACKLSLSDKLKPIDFDQGSMLITDGTRQGWADPHFYIRYVNGTLFPVQ